MTLSFEHPFARKALALAVLASLVVGAILLIALPAWRLIGDVQDEIDELELRLAKVKSFDVDTRNQSSAIGEAKAKFAEQQLYYPASSSTAGAGLEGAVTALLRQNGITVLQSRVQDEPAKNGLKAVSVTISFTSNFESFVMALQQLPNLRPIVLVDRVAVGQSGIISAGQQGAIGPYRQDAILAVEVTVRSIYIDDAKGR